MQAVRIARFRVQGEGGGLPIVEIDGLECINHTGLWNTQSGEESVEFGCPGSGARKSTFKNKKVSHLILLFY